MFTKKRFCLLTLIALTSLSTPIHAGFFSNLVSSIRKKTSSTATGISSSSSSADLAPETTYKLALPSGAHNNFLVKFKLKQTAEKQGKAWHIALGKAKTDRYKITLGQYADGGDHTSARVIINRGGTSQLYNEVGPLPPFKAEQLFWLSIFNNRVMIGSGEPGTNIIADYTDRSASSLTQAGDMVGFEKNMSVDETSIIASWGNYLASTIHNLTEPKEIELFAKNNQIALFTARSTQDLKIDVAGQEFTLARPNAITTELKRIPDMPYWIQCIDRQHDMRVTGGIGVHPGSNVLFDRIARTKAVNVKKLTIKAQPNVKFASIHTALACIPYLAANKETPAFIMRYGSNLFLKNIPLNTNSCRRILKAGRGFNHWHDNWQLEEAGKGLVTWRVAGSSADGIHFLLHKPVPTAFGRTKTEKILSPSAQSHVSGQTRPVTDGQLGIFTYHFNMHAGKAFISKRIRKDDSMFSTDTGSFIKEAYYANQMQKISDEQSSSFWAAVRDGKLIVGQGTAPTEKDLVKRFSSDLTNVRESLPGEMYHYVDADLKNMTHFSFSSKSTHTFYGIQEASRAQPIAPQPETTTHVDNFIVTGSFEQEEDGKTASFARIKLQKPDVEFPYYEANLGFSREQGKVQVTVARYDAQYDLQHIAHRVIPINADTAELPAQKWFDQSNKKFWISYRHGIINIGIGSEPNTDPYLSAIDHDAQPGIAQITQSKHTNGTVNDLSIAQATNEVIYTAMTEEARRIIPRTPYLTKLTEPGKGIITFECNNTIHYHYLSLFSSEKEGNTYKIFNEHPMRMDGIHLDQYLSTQHPHTNKDPRKVVPLTDSIPTAARMWRIQTKAITAATHKRWIAFDGAKIAMGHDKPTLENTVLAWTDPKKPKSPIAAFGVSCYLKAGTFTNIAVAPISSFIKQDPDDKTSTIPATINEAITKIEPTLGLIKKPDTDGKETYEAKGLQFNQALKPGTNDWKHSWQTTTSGHFNFSFDIPEPLETHKQVTVDFNTKPVNGYTSKVMIHHNNINFFDGKAWHIARRGSMPVDGTVREDWHYIPGQKSYPDLKWLTDGYKVSGTYTLTYTPNTFKLVNTRPGEDPVTLINVKKIDAPRNDIAFATLTSSGPAIFANVALHKTLPNVPMSGTSNPVWDDNKTLSGNSFIIPFSCDATSNLNLGLKFRNSEGEGFYRILCGGWGNTKSQIFRIQNGIKKEIFAADNTFALPKGGGTQDYELAVAGDSIKLLHLNGDKKEVVFVAHLPEFSGTYTHYSLYEEQQAQTRGWSYKGETGTVVEIDPGTIKTQFKDKDPQEVIFFEDYKLPEGSTSAGLSGTLLKNTGGSSNQSTAIFHLASNELISDRQGGSSLSPLYQERYSFVVINGEHLVVRKVVYNPDGTFKKLYDVSDYHIPSNHPLYHFTKKSEAIPFSINYDYDRDANEAYFVLTLGTGDEKITFPCSVPARGKPYTDVSRIGIGSGQSEMTFSDLKIIESTAQKTIIAKRTQDKMTAELSQQPNWDGASTISGTEFEIDFASSAKESISIWLKGKQWHYRLLLGGQQNKRSMITRHIGNQSTTLFDSNVDKQDGGQPLIPDSDDIKRYRLLVNANSMKLMLVNADESTRLLFAAGDPAGIAAYTHYLIDSPSDPDIGGSASTTIPTTNTITTKILKDDRKYEYLFYNKHRFLSAKGGTLVSEMVFNRKTITNQDQEEIAAQPTLVISVANDIPTSIEQTSNTINYRFLYSFDFKPTTPEKDAASLIIYKWIYNEDGTLSSRPALFTEEFDLTELSENHPFKKMMSEPVKLTASYEYSQEQNKAFFLFTIGEGENKISRTFVEDAESAHGPPYTDATRFGIGTWMSEGTFSNIGIGNQTAQSAVHAEQSAKDKATTEKDLAEKAAAEAKATGEKAAEEAIAKEKAAQEAILSSWRTHNEVKWHDGLTLKNPDDALIIGILGIISEAAGNYAIEIHLGTSDKKSLYTIEFEPHRNSIELYRSTPDGARTPIAEVTTDLSGWHNGEQQPTFALFYKDGTFDLRLDDQTVLSYTDTSEQKHTGVERVGIASWESIYQAEPFQVKENPRFIEAIAGQAGSWLEEHALAEPNSIYLTGRVTNKGDTNTAASVIYLSNKNAIPAAQYEVVLTHAAGVFEVYLNKISARGTTRLGQTTLVTDQEAEGALPDQTITALRAWALTTTSLPFSLTYKNNGEDGLVSLYAGNQAIWSFNDTSPHATIDRVRFGALHATQIYENIVVSTIESRSTEQAEPDDKEDIEPAEEEVSFDSLDLFDNDVDLPLSVTPVGTFPSPIWTWNKLQAQDFNLADGFILQSQIEMPAFNKFCRGIISFTSADTDDEGNLTIPEVTTHFSQQRLVDGQTVDAGPTGFAGAHYTLVMDATTSRINIYLYSHTKTNIAGGKVISLGINPQKEPFQIQVTSHPAGTADTPLLLFKFAPAGQTVDWDGVPAGQTFSYSPTTGSARGFTHIGINGWNTQMTYSDISLQPLAQPMVEEVIEPEIAELEEDPLDEINTSVETTPGTLVWGDATSASDRLSQPIDLTGGGSMQTSVAFNTPGAEAIIALTSDDRSLAAKSAAYQLTIRPARDSREILVYMNQPNNQGEFINKTKLTQLLPATDMDLAESHTIWLLYKSLRNKREFYLGVDGDVDINNAVWRYTEDTSDKQQLLPLTQFGLGSRATNITYRDITIAGIERTEVTKVTFIKTNPDQFVWDHELLNQVLNTKGGGTIGAEITFERTGHTASIGLTNDKKQSLYEVDIKPISNTLLDVAVLINNRSYGKKIIDIRKIPHLSSTALVGTQLPLWMSYRQRGDQRIFELYLILERALLPGLPEGTTLDPTQVDKQAGITLLTGTALQTYEKAVRDASTAIWQYTTKATDQTPTHFGVTSGFKPLTFHNVSVKADELSQADINLKAIAEGEKESRAAALERNTLDGDDFPLDAQWSRPPSIRKNVRYTFTAKGEEDDRIVLAFKTARGQVEYRIILSDDGSVVTDQPGQYLGAAQGEGLTGVSRSSNIGLAVNDREFWIEIKPKEGDAKKGVLRIGLNKSFNEKGENIVSEEDAKIALHSIESEKLGTEKWYFAIGQTLGSTITKPAGKSIGATSASRRSINRNTVIRKSRSSIASRFG